MIITACVFTFFINRWSVTIICTDGNDVTVEYGSRYEDAGAQAFFHGSVLFPNGWPIELTSEGHVNTNQLGDYDMTYSAHFLCWNGHAVRTVHVSDTTPPVINLIADPEHYTLPGQPYEEEGYTAEDNVDGDLTDNVVSAEKDGIVTYTVHDHSGNTTAVTRKIVYDDPIPPTIALNGDAEMTITAGSAYQEPGFSAEDNVDGDLTQSVIVSGTVNTYRAGTYTLTYSVKDNYQNETAISRTVTVNPIRQPDQVTPSGKIVYLTFDDGPGPHTSRLLDILDQYNVKATFFTVGTGDTSLLKAEADRGHTVAIHSATHDYSAIYASEDAYFSDLKKQQEVIKNTTGISTTLVRFPGGSSNTVSRNYCSGIMAKLTQDLTDMGYQYFDWNVLSGDAGDTTDTNVVIQNVTSGIQQHDISIVLQHDIKGFSVDAVEPIIVWGLANGYTFLPLDATSPTCHHSVNN